MHNLKIEKYKIQFPKILQDLKNKKESRVALLMSILVQTGTN